MTRTIVSEVQRNVMSAHAMVTDIHRTVVRGQGGSGGKHLSVGDGHTLVVTGCPLTVAQTQTRSAI